jgi:hypothetical protein
MDYKRIYDKIIENAKKQEEERRFLKKTQDDYYENHHIIPVSSGGSNLEENIAVLTAREHFLCHWLLYKINPSNANAFSWWMMSNNNGNKFHKERFRQTSKKYEYARIAFSKHITEVNTGRKYTEEQLERYSLSKMGDKNPMYGRKHSIEHRKKLSEISMGENNHFYGKTHTVEVRKKISDAKKLLVGDKHPHYGKDLMKQETKDRFSEMYKGKPRSKPHEIVRCPHCEKEGIKPNMKRWHFDKCKVLKNECVDKFL